MVGKKAVLMLVLLSLGMVAGTLQPAQSVKTAMIDFEGLTEGDIVSSLSHGAGISGDPIEGDVTVFGSNPNFPGNPPDEPPENTAMIFDANCKGGCSGGDDDLDFSRYNLGNGLIISEDLDSSDPDDAEGPGDFYFEIKFSNFGNAKVKLKKLTYADLDGEETGSIEVYKGDQLIMDEQLKKTGNNEKDEIELPGEEVNDIDRLVVKFTGSMMIDNIEIETESNGPNGYIYYLPMANNDPYTEKFNVTIGFEDREADDPERLDYDYNDWAVSIWTIFKGDFVDEDTIKIEKITFEMIPKARGGKIYHQFHLGIDANTFSSDGDYELVVIQGEPGVEVRDPEDGKFKASEGKDFHINFLEEGCDCAAFGDDTYDPQDKYNVKDVKDGKDEPGFRRIEAIRRAELSIEFTPAFEFDLPDYEAHCQGLFFDPHLEVWYDDEEKVDEEKLKKISWKPEKYDPEVCEGNPKNDDPEKCTEYRILCVENPNWQWPEEAVRIDRAYPLVKFTKDEPPRPIFHPGWDLTSNDCVFGDGIPCTKK